MKKLISTDNTEFEQNGAEFAIIDTTQRGGKPIMVSASALSQALRNADEEVLNSIAGVEITITDPIPDPTPTPEPEPEPVVTYDYEIPTLDFSFPLAEYEATAQELEEPEEKRTQIIQSILAKGTITIHTTEDNKVYTLNPVESEDFTGALEAVLEEDETTIRKGFLFVEQGYSYNLCSWDENKFYLYIGPEYYYKTTDATCSVNIVIPNDIPITFGDGTKSATISMTLDDKAGIEGLWGGLFEFPYNARNLIVNDPELSSIFNSHNYTFHWYLTPTPVMSDFMSQEDIEHFIEENGEGEAGYLNVPYYSVGSSYYNGYSGSVILKQNDTLTLHIEIGKEKQE